MQVQVLVLALQPAWLTAQILLTGLVPALKLKLCRLYSLNFLAFKRHPGKDG